VTDEEVVQQDAGDRPEQRYEQVPRPGSNTTKVPKNSASIAPGIPARSLVKAVGLSGVSAAKVVNVESPTRSSLLWCTRGGLGAG
jgi:hypothetical protein